MTFLGAWRQTFHQRLLLFVLDGGVCPGLEKELNQEYVVEPDRQMSRSVPLRVLEVQQELSGDIHGEKRPHNGQASLPPSASIEI